MYNSKATTVEIEFLRDSDQDAPGCTDSLHAVIMTRWPVAHDMHEVPACPVRHILYWTRGFCISSPTYYY